VGDPPGVDALVSEPWGLSGPQFLVIYLVAVAVALILVGVLRWAGRTAAPTSTAAAPPTIDELAFVAGGVHRVVEAAVARLIESGALRPARRGTVTATGGPPRDAIEAAALGAVGAGSGSQSIWSIVRGAAPSSAVRAIAESATARGLVLSRGANRRRVWLAALPLLIVFGVGIARWINGNQLGRPVTLLTILLVITALPLIPVLRTPRHTRTRRGDELLSLARESRRTGQYYAGSQGLGTPAYFLTGAAGMVAIGGLMAYPDPLVQSSLVGYSGSSYSSSSSSSSCSSSSSSCSSSSSSSCSSGSSCGGGGGGCGG
jgi:uncharacterized protein (TIGR04222 family)